MIETTVTSCCLRGGADISTSEDILHDSFQSVGQLYGYEEVDVSFASFKEFKSTWQRAGKSVVLQISDYLEGSDRGIMEDFAHSLYKRIAHHGMGEIYTDRLRAWLLSPQFLVRNQPLYLKRSRNLSRDPRGRVYDLKESYYRLRDQGLIHDGADAVLNWTVRGNRMRVGYCSVLMKVVAISSLLDSDKVPDFVHEYVLYHELLHIENGLDTGSRHHGAAFRRKERLHPRWKESEEWLKRLACRRADIGRSIGSEAML